MSSHAALTIKSLYTTIRTLCAEGSKSMKSKMTFLMVAIVSAFLLLPGMAIADERLVNSSPQDGAGVETCSDEQFEADRNECPGYWADFAYAGESRPDRVVEGEESGPGSQGGSYGLYVLGCDYDTRGDHPHKSNDPPGDVSVHGWWIDNSGGDGSCPSLADVSVELSALWCAERENGSTFCWFHRLDHDSQRIGARNITHQRINARHPCHDDGSYYRYKNVVDVDLVGQADSPFHYWVVKDVQCRPNTP